MYIYYLSCMPDMMNDDFVVYTRVEFLFYTSTQYVLQKLPHRSDPPPSPSLFRKILYEFHNVIISAFSQNILVLLLDYYYTNGPKRIIPIMMCIYK